MGNMGAQAIAPGPLRLGYRPCIGHYYTPYTHIHYMGNIWPRGEQPDQEKAAITSDNTPHTTASV